MSEDNAGTIPVEKTDAVTTPPAAVDKDLVELQAKYEALEVEKENYRKGMLKAKGKLPDEADTEDIEERMRRIVREENAATREAQIIREQQGIVKGLVKKNSELATALKNRAQTSSGSIGSSTEETETPKADPFSKETIAEFKAKGYDDAKIARIKQSYLQYKQ